MATVRSSRVSRARIGAGGMGEVFRAIMADESGLRQWLGGLDGIRTFALLAA